MLALNGVTLGKIPAVARAKDETLEFTAKNFQNSATRHGGQMIGTAIAVGATLGQCKTVNESCARSSKKFGEKATQNVNGIANAIPVVGHVKGVVHYACGDHKGGEAAMIASSRTVGVVGGAVGGAVGGFFCGGPVGAVVGGAAGGVGGGAGMDTITTGINSAIKGEFVPAGQISGWTKAINNENPQELLDGLFCLSATPIADAAVGASVGAAVAAGGAAPGISSEVPNPQWPQIPKLEIPQIPKVEMPTRL